MFNGLISKSVIRDNILILIPHNITNDEIMILISHGSGGIGNAEWNAANFFLSVGYKVGILDYFSKWNIKKLWWTCIEKFKDNHNVTFNQMLTDITFPDTKIIHIGFSLGGFLGLLNSHLFLLNYSFYPGIIAYTNEMIQKDYSNSTVIVAEQDNWCNNYQIFDELCVHPPKKIVLNNVYHGFMIPEKDHTFIISKYNFPIDVITLDEFDNLKPNHDQLEKMYGSTDETVRLTFDEKECTIQLNQILEEIRNL